MDGRRLIPAIVSPPGEIIEEELIERGWSQRDLAKIMGRPYQTINEIIRGTKQITPDTAQEFAQAFSTSPELWLNLETSYRLYLAREKGTTDQTIARRSRLYSIAPVAELIKRSWIRNTNDIEELEKEICAFLKIKSLDDALLRPNANFRIGGKDTPENISLYAWTKRVAHLCKNQTISPYRPENFSHLLERLLTFSQKVEDIKHVPETLIGAGIHFVIVPQLQKTHLDGATLHNGNPIVALTLRYDRIDYFWFTLLHELAHISEGGSHEYLDDLDEVRKSNEEYEVRANLMASNWLVNQSDIDLFVCSIKPHFSKMRIEEYADQINRHPGIILGQLQHRGDVSYQHLRSLLVKVKPQLENWIDIS